jgi:hypothetical protein
VQLNGSANPVSIPLWPIMSYENYAMVSLKELNSWPTRYFYDNQFPYGNVFIYPIPSPSYEIHLILGSQLGFSTTIETGTINDAGSGYTDGVYVAVPLINVGTSNGISATANVTIAGGIVTAFAIQNGGMLYKIGDKVTLDTATVGAGTDFLWTVDTLTSTLDSIMEFPEYYNRAMIKNLALELFDMYQMEPSQNYLRGARASLKAVIGANTQVPTLVMPGTLRNVTRRRAGIVNADGGVVWGDVAA